VRSIKVISAGVSFKALAAANPPNPAPTMMILGCAMLTSIYCPFVQLCSERFDFHTPNYVTVTGSLFRVKFGWRFSRNAGNASLASAEWSRAAYSSFSSFAACAS
jgi:hypothetical protein